MKKILMILLILLMTVPVKAKTLNSYDGVNYYNGRKETYYNLKMDRIIEKAQAHGIYGAYWVREDGVKMYGHYVIIAAPFDVYPYGSIVESTSLGDAIVLDTGEFAKANKQQIDVAVTW